MTRFVLLLAATLGLGSALLAEGTDATRTYPALRPRLMFTPDALAGLPHRDFPGDLVEVWVTDTDGYLTFLDDETLRSSGQDQAEVEALALENLGSKVAAMHLSPLQDVRVLELDGVYESSILVLPEVWNRLDETMGAVVVAVPTRDVVLLADGDVSAQVQTLRRIVEQVRGRYPNWITGDLFRWDGHAWHELPR